MDIAISPRVTGTDGGWELSTLERLATPVRCNVDDSMATERTDEGLAANLSARKVQHELA